MSNVEISGVFAALLTPRNGEGSVDVPALRRLVHFLTKSGSSSFAVNGATGEFCLTSPAELRTMLSTVRARGEGKARILCCVGGAGAAQSIELARVAESEEADGLLLPMPYFYPYAQEDLDLFCRTVAGTTRLPVLLYNLAAVHFRTGQGNGEQPRQRSPQYRWNQGFERFTRDSALPHAARCPGLPDRRQRRHARTRTARGNLRWRCLRYCRCCAGSDSRGLCAQTSDRVGRFFFRCTAN
jgi:hypothetical protein